MKLRFENDYAEGAHTLILQRLAATNDAQSPGYGLDAHCERARGLVRGLCKNEDLDIHFFAGGTQANLTVIAAALRPHQGVVAASSAHIATHETGAIEATGHSILTLESNDGKIAAGQVAALCEAHLKDASFEHTVQPAMVYISYPTECGTLYTKQELAALRQTCDEYGLLLYLDGARLAYGLAAPQSDINFADIASLCDVFYIGGTKVGALFGEAVVIRAPALQKDFRYVLKQRGAMLAKGRILGIQFEVLLQNNLYVEIAQHAIQQAQRLKDAFAAKGYKLLYSSPTNQVFPVLPNEVYKKLEEDFAFQKWARHSDTHTAARFCTSWATKPGSVTNLIEAVQRA